MLQLDLAQQSWQDTYKLLSGSILPRPIAFVSTVNGEGVANLAPFSFFTAICAEPPLICFAPMRRGSDGAKKDTLCNIEETKEFVVNVVSESFVSQMNEAAREFPSDVDEFAVTGLQMAPSIKIKPARVAEAMIQMECVLEELLHFGAQEGGGSLVIGRILLIHVDEAIYDEGRILGEQLQPVGRLAGHAYTRPFSDTFILERKK